MCATFPNDGGFTSISPRRGASFPAGVSGLPEPCSELMTLALCPHLVILALVHQRVRGRLAALHPATSNKHAKPLCTVRNGLETFHATSLRSHSGKDGRNGGGGAKKSSNCGGIKRSWDLFGLGAVPCGDPPPSASLGGRGHRLTWLSVLHLLLQTVGSDTWRAASPSSSTPERTSTAGTRNATKLSERYSNPTASCPGVFIPR